MKIHLIRHGKTIANEKKLYCGSTDIPLSYNGILELESLKKEIKYPTGDLLISSGLLRASQTTKIIYKKNPDLLISELNEFNFGLFEMKSYDQLKKNPFYINWIENYEEAECINGESKKIFDNRIHLALKKLTDIKQNNLVVVCHGGVIATIMEIFFPSRRNFYEWQPACGRGYTLEADRNFKNLVIQKI